MSFEVETEERRELKWKNTEKEKVPLHDWVQLRPVQPLILKELLHYLSSSCHNENMQRSVQSTFINAVWEEVWNWLCYCGSERNAESNWRDKSKLKMFTHPHAVSRKNVILFFILMMREVSFLDELSLSCAMFRCYQALSLDKRLCMRMFGNFKPRRKKQTKH